MVMQIQENNFNDFWMGLLKDGHGHLVHDTLKSAELVYGLSRIFVAHCDAIIFY